MARTWDPSFTLFCPLLPSLTLRSFGGRGGYGLKRSKVGSKWPKVGSRWVQSGLKVVKRWGQSGQNYSGKASAKKGPAQKTRVGRGFGAPRQARVGRLGSGPSSAARIRRAVAAHGFRNGFGARNRRMSTAHGSGARVRRTESTDGHRARIVRFVPRHTDSTHGARIRPMAHGFSTRHTDSTHGARIRHTAHGFSTQRMD